MSSNSEKRLKNQINNYKKKSANSLQKAKNITKGRNPRTLPKNIKQRAYGHLRRKEMYNKQVFKLEQFLKNIESQKRKVKTLTSLIDRTTSIPNKSYPYYSASSFSNHSPTPTPTPSPSPNVSLSNLQRRLRSLKGNNSNVRSSPNVMSPPSARSSPNVSLSNLQRRLRILKGNNPNVMSSPNVMSPPSIRSPPNVSLSNLQRRLNALKSTKTIISKPSPSPLKSKKKTPAHLRYRPPTPPKRRKRKKQKKKKSVRSKIGKSIKSLFKRKKNVFV